MPARGPRNRKISTRNFARWLGWRPWIARAMKLLRPAEQGTHTSRRPKPTLKQRHAALALSAATGGSSIEEGAGDAYLAGGHFALEEVRQLLDVLQFPERERVLRPVLRSQSRPKASASPSRPEPDSQRLVQPGPWLRTGGPCRHPHSRLRRRPRGPRPAGSGIDPTALAGSRSTRAEAAPRRAEAGADVLRRSDSQSVPRMSRELRLLAAIEAPTGHRLAVDLAPGG